MRKNLLLLILLSCLMCSLALAESKDTPTEKDDYGLTPLHRAAVKGDVELVKSLLEKGAEVDSRDDAGRTALHYATGAAFGNKSPDWKADTTTLLLDKGANISAQDNIGWTPLHYAAFLLNKDMVQYLIKKGADLDIVDERGFTPYLWNRAKTSYFQGMAKFDTLQVVDWQKSLQKYTDILALLRKSNNFYVATNGSDANPGTLSSPFRTITAAVKDALPGDTVLVRGGEYQCQDTIRLVKSGEEGKPISIKPYGGEKPILNFSAAKGDSFLITGAYWHLKDLTITNGFRGAIGLYGDQACHNVLEQMKVYANRYTGIRIEAGAAYNILLNCDSCRNFDHERNGQDSDGFGVYWNVGEGNILIGNRSWNNSDDGFDLWDSGRAVRLENCYAWRNGENIWQHPFFIGNGNGFKLGKGDGRHVIIDCVVWGHKFTGFNLNGNSSGVILYNCTAIDSGNNYAFWNGSSDCVLANNISYRGRNITQKGITKKSNSWDKDLSLTLTDSDFLSLDDTKVTAPRNPDGSIPENDFLRLSPNSKANDKGIDVNMSYEGKAPDLGAFEYRPASKQPYIKMLHQYVRDHDVKKIKELLEKGEDVNGKDWLGYAPLHWAIYFGYSDITEMLIEKGAIPNLISDTGRTSLEIAGAMGYGDLAELLRKKSEEERERMRQEFRERFQNRKKQERKE